MQERVEPSALKIEETQTLRIGLGNACQGMFIPSLVPDMFSDDRSPDRALPRRQSGDVGFRRCARGKGEEEGDRNRCQDFIRHFSLPDFSGGRWLRDFAQGIAMNVPSAGKLTNLMYLLYFSYSPLFRQGAADVKYAKMSGPFSRICLNYLILLDFMNLPYRQADV